jgi:hypothetical protein
VAPPGYRIGQGDRVVSVGCNNGGAATAVATRVTSLDKFLGPPNIQVAGQPIEGRSGGGLFSAEGLVLGVCNAADPSDREGLFAGLPSIQSILDRKGLAAVYRPAGENAVASTAPVPSGMLVPVDLPAASPAMPGLPQGMASLAEMGKPGAAPASGGFGLGNSGGLSKEEQAALEEIRRRAQEGAEVVCVIRSRKDPSAKSEVITLDKVSPDFVRQLAANQTRPVELTSLEIPKKREETGGVAPSNGEPSVPPLPALPSAAPATGISLPQWNGMPSAWPPAGAGSR